MRERLPGVDGAYAGVVGSCTMGRLAALLAATTLALGPAAVPAAASAPRTGFERSAGAAWTTLADEARFLRTLDAASRRVSVREIGRSDQGRPIRLVRIGTGPRRVLLVCSQHGDEPAGREACLRTVRDLALATDGRTRRLLARTTALVVPTANPDGRSAGTRGTGLGVDVNRDHAARHTPEARAVAAVLRSWRPDVLLDLHEYVAAPGGSGPDLTYRGPGGPRVQAGVHAAAAALAAGAVGPAVRAAGFTTGVFGGAGRPGSTDEDVRTLRTSAALTGIATLLVETRIDRGLESDPARRARRVAAQLAAIRAALPPPRRDHARAATAG